MCTGVKLEFRMVKNSGKARESVIGVETVLEAVNWLGAHGCGPVQIVLDVVGQIQSVQGSDLKDAAVMTRVVVRFVVESVMHIKLLAATIFFAQYDISILIWKDPKEDTGGCNLETAML
ncbi:hypothetical protein YC2023_042424 [Brassica napus]